MIGNKPGWVWPIDEIGVCCTGVERALVSQRTICPL